MEGDATLLRVYVFDVFVIVSLILQVVRTVIGFSTSNGFQKRGRDKMGHDETRHDNIMYQLNECSSKTTKGREG